MDRTKYQDIRKKINLSQNKNALSLYWAQNSAMAGLVIYFAAQQSYARFLAIPLLAAFIFRNFSMMHEAVHNAASRNKTLNDWNGIFAGAVCLLPFEPWKKSHLEHHQWSGNIERDPVMAVVRVFPKMTPASRGFFSFFWRAWFPMLACMQYFVFWALAMKIYIQKPKSLKVAASLLSPIVFWTAAIALFPLHVQIIAPSILLYFLAVEVVNFPHHLQLPQHGGDTKFPVWEQYRIARSCVYPRWFGRLIVLNFNYHIEHHMFPDVPWYHLEKLHAEVRTALSENYNTDPYFAWILENKQKPLLDVLKSAPPAPHASDKVA